MNVLHRLSSHISSQDYPIKGPEGGEPKWETGLVHLPEIMGGFEAWPA